MKRVVRAGGMAAAIGLLLSAFQASPSQAGEVETVATGSYLDHASAEIQAEEMAEVADRMVKLANHATPRPRSLPEMVDQLGGVDTRDEEQHCLAGAVYFEARGESLEGQLAVAEVVLNRASSKKYPKGICKVVTQPWQFSFIQKGEFPPINKASKSWRKAVAIAKIAQGKLDGTLADGVLWYHADYVSPSWGKRLDREKKIGLHIFYS
jgi:spore germination cell wall hydrolase CwlJ-like protein